MAEKKLKYIDLESYTIISTGIATLLSIIASILIVGIFVVAVPNSFGVMIYIFPTIVFGTMISNIFVNFSTGYLYNVLSKRLGFIKFDIEENPNNNPFDFDMSDNKKSTFFELFIGFTRIVLTFHIFMPFDWFGLIEIAYFILTKFSSFLSYSIVL